MTENSQKKTTRRSRATILFIGTILLAFIFIRRHETVNTIECTPQIIKQKPDIVMLGAWWCSYCYQAKAYFQKIGISYCEYDMENTKIGKQLYKKNGGGAIPLLLIGNYRIRGFDPERIKIALSRLHNQNNLLSN